MTRDPGRRPVYARVLRLRHLRPSSLLCFGFFEGMLALGVLLALAELTNWWAVLVLPAVVAAMVKMNDLLAGALAGRPAPAYPVQLGPPPQRGGTTAPRHRVARAQAAVPAGRSRTLRHGSGRDPVGNLDPVDSPQQRFRQSARRRYQ